MYFYLLLISIFIIFISNYHYLKKATDFIKIPKGTVLYHSSFTDIENYTENRYSWFSDDPYYIYKVKNCNIYQYNHCKYNEYYPINQKDNLLNFKKAQCQKIKTYKLILKKDLILLKIPDEILLNFLDFFGFKNTGFIAEKTALGEKKKVYVIKYNKNLFTNSIVNIQENDIINRQKIWKKNINCGYLVWAFHIMQKNLFYIPYLYCIQNKLEYMEKYYSSSILLNTYAKNKINHKTNNCFRVSSYNVHGWRDPMENWNQDNILKNIILTNSDIVCMQEFIYSNEVINKLKKYYPYYCYYGDLSIFSKYKIMNKNHITLGRDNFYFIQRYLLCIEVKINNRNIHILNTHLDVFDLTEDMRFKQINLILTQIKNIESNNPKDLILLMGDFNSINKDDYTKDYFNKILMKHPKHIPSDKNMRVIKEIEKYMYDTKKIDANSIMRNVKNQITVWSMRRVDYIFINKNTIKLNHYINVSDNSSDHYLIYNDIDITSIN